MFLNLFTKDSLDAISTSLILAFVSTLISAILGISLGIILEEKDFKLKPLVIRLIRTLMALPPVVVGLVVYLLLMRKGPLGSLGWLFTIQAMVIAQVIIITPIMAGMTYSYAREIGPDISELIISLGGSKSDRRRLMLREMKSQIYFILITGFSRSISEVGAVILVGGNIKGRTRTMTTSISLLRSQGIYSEGIFLGAVLLVITFILQYLIEKLDLGDKL